jgi:beta-phosphoglucomutase-like phosphatase (HAD superfamily)
MTPISGSVGQNSSRGPETSSRVRTCTGQRSCGLGAGHKPDVGLPAGARPMPEAVIFDLDGVLMDSEQRWNEAKEGLGRETGGRWRDEAPRVMMGMSSPEWSTYLHDDLGVPMDAKAIGRDVVQRMEAGYHRALPLLPGAEEAVRALARHWPLELASSSNWEIIDLVLELADFGAAFRVTVSSEEVERQG